MYIHIDIFLIFTSEVFFFSERVSLLIGFLELLLLDLRYAIARGFSETELGNLELNHFFAFFLPGKKCLDFFTFPEVETARP